MVKIRLTSKTSNGRPNLRLPKRIIRRTQRHPRQGRQLLLVGLDDVGKLEHDGLSLGARHRAPWRIWRKGGFGVLDGLVDVVFACYGDLVADEISCGGIVYGDSGRGLALSSTSMKLRPGPLLLFCISTINILQV